MVEAYAQLHDLNTPLRFVSASLDSTASDEVDKTSFGSSSAKQKQVCGRLLSRKESHDEQLAGKPPSRGER